MSAAALFLSTNMGSLFHDYVETLGNVLAAASSRYLSSCLYSNVTVSAILPHPSHFFVYSVTLQRRASFVLTVAKLFLLVTKPVILLH